MRVRACIVRAPNWVGDAVMSLGAIRELRRLVGGARLAVAAKSWVAAIYEESGLVDEVVPLERRAWRDALDHARAIRAGGYDVAVLFQNAFQAALVARMARVPRIVGYGTERRGFLLTDVVAMPPDHRREHQSRYYMNVVGGFERAFSGTDTVRPERADCSLRVQPSTVALGWEVLENLGLPAGTPLVAVNPGATNSRAKQWLPDRFAAAAADLAGRHGATILVLGSDAEASTARAVIAALPDPSRAVDLAGRTTLRALIGILAASKALLSNDTGPAHLAGAIGVPTITIFGPTERFATEPLGIRAASVIHPVECAPCMLRDCPIDHRCMTGVSVAAVVSAAEAEIEAASAQEGEPA